LLVLSSFSTKEKTGVLIGDENLFISQLKRADRHLEPFYWKKQ